MCRFLQPFPLLPCATHAASHHDSRARQPPHHAPLAPHLAAAADVCDGEDEASVQQAEAVGRKVRVVADLVGSVAVEQARVRAVQLGQASTIDQGDGDLIDGGGGDVAGVAARRSA